MSSAEHDTGRDPARARRRSRYALVAASLAAALGLGTAAGAQLSGQVDSSDIQREEGLLVIDPEAAADACGEGDFHAEAVKDGSTWTSRNGEDVLYEGADMLAAMRAAVDSLSPGRTAQERVVVRGSGSMAADTSLDLPSHTSLEVCGTIDVTGGSPSAHAPVRIRHATNVSVPHLSVTGTPYFGVYVRTSQNVHLGQIDLRLSGGLGMRIDSRDDDSVRGARDISIDDVYVSGTSGHGVETYGVDGLTIGTVTARDTGNAGLLLNDTVNATVDLVDAEGAGTGTGYAAFRMANRNGRVGSGYPTNIRVGEVRARGGGRGIFCVSESGGAVIERVDIAETGNNAVLVENCHNVTIGEEGGTITGPGDVRVAARDEFANTSGVTFENLTLTDTALNENPCAVDTVVREITWNNSQDNSC
ncbi:MULTISPECIES: right-handed parallel beta-helix repeat-containing protein [unclassified Nocardiopsis]|uniref:right-handed parallel beta-helix repeat-containing protein n=1 Tax=unclassified Nocardiopsis TaxID=2649073 RepID=UPI001F34E83C|nr:MULTISPECIES: right-handed parallel beta-helix repeat-containing protein [unclassified Nocardiopsis]